MWPGAAWSKVGHTLAFVDLNLCMLCQLSTTPAELLNRNQTQKRGEALTLEQLTDACRKHFFSGKPCAGYPEDDDEQGGVR